MPTQKRFFELSIDRTAERISLELEFVTIEGVVTATSADGHTGTGASQHEATLNWLKSFWGID